MNSLLPWYALLLPLASAALIMLLTHRLRGLSSFISVVSVIASFTCCCLIFRQHDITAPSFIWLRFQGQLKVPIGFSLDQLSKTMLTLVTGIGALIHIYSLGYMREDEGKSRYFASLSLFMFAMIGIVLANNFVMMFLFWELVGLCSFLLIGHWFDRDSAARAANKAFITNRLGDFGFMLGILMVWLATGSVVFDDIVPQLSKITSNPGYLTTAVLLIFCGAVGKSAQFPLHVWLPDAMEGPTPISALIHAATMVAAGVYMLVRVGFLIQASQDALNVIAWVGTITAVMAALIATQQDDIKKILAYSTLSQLGYMIMAVGLASGEAAMFHLFTHAFFKALLFLGAGSLIAMMHHEQNIWKMGGQGKNMFITFLTFAVGTLALIGCPPFSGFWSKDAILGLAFNRNLVIFGLALFTAFLTAFYMLRLMVVVFFGKPRSPAARSSDEAPAVMVAPLVILAIFAAIAGFNSVAGRFLTLPHERDTFSAIPVVAIGTTLLGSVIAIVLYRRRESEPLDLRLLRRKFFVDEVYAWLISSTQDLLALIAAFTDRWIIDAGGVRGVSGATWGIGSLLRLFQVGNLQVYSLIFGAGVVGLLYFALMR